MTLIQHFPTSPINTNFSSSCRFDHPPPTTHRTDSLINSFVDPSTMSLSLSPQHQPETETEPGPVSIDNSAVSPPSSHRKFPPPCWTHEESVALIEVYRHKWFSLRRTNLRSNDWESVAADVARRCPLVPCPKSSVQCRHKMDKLRKRYREEKQRATAHPNRFFTSWVLFHLMDSLENERSSSFSSLSDNRNNPSHITGIKRKASSGYRLGTVPFPRFRERNPLYKKAVRFAVDSRDHDMDEGSDDIPGHSEADGLVLHTHECNIGSLHKRIGPKHGEENSRLGDGFPVSTFGDRISPQPCSVSKVRVKVEASGAKTDSFVFPAKPLGRDTSRKFTSVGFNLKNHREFDGNSYSGASEFEKKRRRSNYGSERSDESAADILSSINMVGGELLKLEKMKIEMAQEIEKRRMKMEMKHTELILQLQLQIVDSFAKALF